MIRQDIQYIYYMIKVSIQMFTFNKSDTYNCFVAKLLR